MKVFYLTKNGVIAPRLILRWTVAVLMVSNIAWLGWGARFGEMVRSPDYRQDLLVFSLIGVVIGEFIFRLELRNMKGRLSDLNLRRFIFIQVVLGVFLPWLFLYKGGHYLPAWLGIELDMFYYYRYRLPYAVCLLSLLNVLYFGSFMICQSCYNKGSFIR